MKFPLFVFALFACLLTQAQTDQSQRERAYAAYSVLEGGSWEIDAYFIEGTHLQQRFEVSYSADSAIFTTSTFRMAENGNYVLQSEGVRAWDDATRTFRFWEFGVDGSIVEGSIVIQGQNILHIYEYDNEILTDLYSFERDGLYELIIGQKEGDQWPVLHANGGVKKLE